MKPITIALLTIALVLSACTTRVSQEPESHPQTSTSRPAQKKNLTSKQPGLSYPDRSSWGGFPLYTAGSLWGGISLYPARSLWGGFPLHPVTIVSMDRSSSTASSSEQPSDLAPACDPTQESCIVENHFSFQQPFSSNFNNVVEPAYIYGSTEFGVLEPHHGVEIENPTGTPILAVSDGIVIVAGSDAHHAYGPRENFYGNLVVLAHNLSGLEEPVYTLYGHLSGINVQVGQAVQGGEVIGEVGATGRAFGSHLHFEVRVGTNHYEDTRNPALWLYPCDDENGQPYGALVGKLDNPQGDPIYATIKAEYYPDLNEPPDKTFYIETYATDIETIKSDETYRENFVLTDLPPGHYRLALSASGKWTERWIEVESGKLSFVSIVSR